MIGYIWQSVFMVATMAFLINDNHKLFNNMDAYCSFMLGCSYFANPGYLVVKAWNRATVLLSSFLNLTATDVEMYEKRFWGMVVYWAPGIPYCCMVDVVDVTHPFGKTTYPSLLFRIIILLSQPTCKASVLFLWSLYNDAVLCMVYIFLAHSAYVILHFLNKYIVLCGHYIFCMPCAPAY